MTDLTGFLDWYRGVVEHKLDGLTLEQVTAVTMPSGTTMLGIMKHLAWAERRWFRHYFLGEPREPVDVSESFVIRPDDTIASVVRRYHEDCETSRRIVAAAPSVDRLGAFPHDVFGDVTLEWMIVHMVEETARHAGHLDILRELTDGRVGD